MELGAFEALGASGALAPESERDEGREHAGPEGDDEEGRAREAQAGVELPREGFDHGGHGGVVEKLRVEG